MTMRDAGELRGRRPMVDLTGPEGNAFVLLGYAGRWAEELGMDGPAIIEDMTSDDYEHLLAVLEKHFGDYVDFYR